MIEEILTDHREHKASAPVGDFLKFGVHALLSARPLHNQLGKRAEASPPPPASPAQAALFCFMISIHAQSEAACAVRDVAP